MYGEDLNRGQVMRATNDKGELPDVRPPKTKRVLVSIDSRTGINLEHTFKDVGGRLQRGSVQDGE